MKRTWAVGALVILAASLAQGVAGERAEVQTLPLRQIHVEDQFWAPKLRVYHDRTIPHSWQYVDDTIRAVRKAAGENVATNCDCTWAEANLYKFLETAACSLAQFPDKELEGRVDEIIASLAKAQRPDGYSHVYVFLAGKRPWDPEFPRRLARRLRAGPPDRGGIGVPCCDRQDRLPQHREEGCGRGTPALLGPPRPARFLRPCRTGNGAREVVPRDGRAALPGPGPGVHRMARPARGQAVQRNPPRVFPGCRPPARSADAGRPCRPGRVLR